MCFPFLISREGTTTQVIGAPGKYDQNQVVGTRTVSELLALDPMGLQLAFRIIAFDPNINKHERSSGHLVSGRADIHRPSSRPSRRTQSVAKNSKCKQDICNWPLYRGTEPGVSLAAM